MNDILERLKASSKVNGAYQKDIEDAITEIKKYRLLEQEFLFHLNQDKDGDFFLTKESYNELFVSD